MMRHRLVVLLLLLPLLLAVFGFAPGPEMSSEEAQRAASSVPEVADLLSHPTVKSTAEYQASDDAWRVLIRESVEGMILAELSVSDDTQDVEQVQIYPSAETATYPNLSEDDAIKLALASPEVRSELSDHAPYTSEAEYEDGEWTVHLKVEEDGLVGGMPLEDGIKEIVRVGVDDDTWQLNYVWSGDQVGWHMARGDYGAYGKQANYWYVWGSLAFLFAVAFWRPDKLLSLRNLDVIALLGFLVSHGFFREGDSYWAVVLWYPPLLYLLGRTLMMGFGYGERVERTSNLPTPVLFVLGLLGSGLVLGLNLDSRVIDVGYAGVVGGDRILDGTVPYGNMPSNVGTGDTYGPLNYLLYTPFRWYFGWSGEWDFLPAAHGLTALAFVVGAIALFIAGYKYAGSRGGSTLLFAWAIFPYTLYSTNNNTNDVIIAAVAAIGLATAANPLARGASVTAGFAIKLFPIILGPLWLLHDGVRRRVPLLDFVLGGVVIILLSFWVLALDGDLIGGAKLFYEKTIAFQGTRETPWTIFSQVPELKVLQQPLTALAILLAFVVAIFPKKRTIRRLAAFSAALIIAFELTVNYWFYPYVTWFEPFIFLALLVETNEKTALDGDREEKSEDPRPENGDERRMDPG
ncbi:MAG TPA: glycosyltransferase family 87 protein [Rubrobacteraceae bacterium]|nr:glycosyltransferase family 87 protein [Rubrobacteraceae bacterium]